MLVTSFLISKESKELQKALQLWGTVEVKA